MRNLLDLMTPEDRQKIKENPQWRLSTKILAGRINIPPEIFTVAELGYYYGWGAIETFKRGYVEAFRNIKKNGETIECRTKIPFSMDEAVILIEAAKKIVARNIVNDACGTQTAITSAMSKNPQRVFDEGMKSFKERARL